MNPLPLGMGGNIKKPANTTKKEFQCDCSDTCRNKFYEELSAQIHVEAN